MFQNPFSFDGRIRRTEYGISCIIYGILSCIISAIAISGDGSEAIFNVAYIPMLWFFWAQGAKRCHDLGNNGWYQIIPFYGLWMLFQDGQYGFNTYGENPKNIGNVGGYAVNGSVNNNAPAKGTSTGYQDGYDGGHNNPGNNPTYNQSEMNSPYRNTDDNGYNSGDLYK